MILVSICPTCHGAGTIRHPAWGTRNCPEPEVECPMCGGSGEVIVDDEEEVDGL